MHETLSQAQLNRATLARQMLLAREKTTALKAIERLAGMQAQVARPPFVGLWTRLHGFEREDLLKLLHNRQVIKATVMRGTLHLLTARDFLAFRMALQPMLSKGFQTVSKGAGNAVPAMDELVKVARAAFAEGRPFGDVRPLLKQAFPKCHDRLMGYGVRCHLPLVQVPSKEEPWGYASDADFIVADTWLKKPIGPGLGAAPLILRYLAAFGPATTADVQCWSGMTGLAETMDGLRKKLVTFRDEKGRELFDLPNAPRPAAATPVPVRFLPDFDNLVLGHADRSRFIDDAHRKLLVTKNLLVPATFLVDGRVAGTWKIERKKAVAALRLTPFVPVPKPARRSLEEEGQQLARFVEPDAATFEFEFIK